MDDTRCSVCEMTLVMEIDGVTYNFLHTDKACLQEAKFRIGILKQALHAQMLETARLDRELHLLKDYLESVHPSP